MVCKHNVWLNHDRGYILRLVVLALSGRVGLRAGLLVLTLLAVEKVESLQVCVTESSQLLRMNLLEWILKTIAIFHL